MKKLVLVIAFLSVSIAFAQSNKAEAKVLSEFQTAYNAENHEGIFKMYSQKKQSNFPIERVKTFFERVNQSKGNLSSFAFVRTEQNFTVYKAVFTKAVGEVVIKLNNKGKANELSIRNTVAVKQ